jgi:hypothetical protein
VAIFLCLLLLAYCFCTTRARHTEIPYSIDVQTVQPTDITDSTDQSSRHSVPIDSKGEIELQSIEKHGPTHSGEDYYEYYDEHAEEL